MIFTSFVSIFDLSFLPLMDNPFNASMIFILESKIVTVE